MDEIREKKSQKKREILEKEKEFEEKGKEEVTDVWLCNEES